MYVNVQGYIPLCQHELLKSTVQVKGWQCNRWVSVDQYSQVSQVDGTSCSLVGSSPRGICSGWWQTDPDENTKDMNTSVRRHQCTPVALGLRASDVAHKAAALMWSFFLRCPGLAALLRFISSFFTCTTDLGTEASLTTFKFGTIGNLLPAWAAQAMVPLCVEDEAVDEVGMTYATTIPCYPYAS